MNSCEPRRAESIAGDQPPDAFHPEPAEPVAALLDDVRLRFYITQPAAVFRRDRRRLIYALTWPALWLDRRGLFCSPQRYRSLVVERLDAIRAHGDPAHYGAYFPTYLLKCLQDHFDRHGDELDGELKHVRNALDVVGGALRFAEQAQVQSRRIDAMAQVHRCLRAHAPPTSDPNQLALF